MENVCAIACAEIVFSYTVSRGLSALHFFYYIPDFKYASKMCFRRFSQVTSETVNVQLLVCLREWDEPSEHLTCAVCDTVPPSASHLFWSLITSQVKVLLHFPLLKVAFAQKHFLSLKESSRKWEMETWVWQKEKMFSAEIQGRTLCWLIDIVLKVNGSTWKLSFT